MYDYIDEYIKYNYINFKIDSISKSILYLLFHILVLSILVFKH